MHTSTAMAIALCLETLPHRPGAKAAKRHAPRKPTLDEMAPPRIEAQPRPAFHRWPRLFQAARAVTMFSTA